MLLINRHIVFLNTHKLFGIEVFLITVKIHTGLESNRSQPKVLNINGFKRKSVYIKNIVKSTLS